MQTWRECFRFETVDTLWIALDGDPYWSLPVLEKLAGRKGHAAALAQAYREYGSDLFRYIHGPFSFAIIDHDEDAALLAIDRLGIHTLCYAEIPGRGLVFGSNADAVKGHPAVSRTVTPQGIFNYFYFFVSPAPGTVYRDQSKLLPAQYLNYRNGTLRKEFYWRVPYEERVDGDVGELSEELMELLRRAMERSVAGNSPAITGAFLSGGLDSSTIVGLLARESRDVAKCFTIGFRDDAFNEMAYARIAARHSNAKHFEYILTASDALDLIPRMADVYDEPFGNSSAIPTYYCAKLARGQDVEIILAGDGGDEIFAGNERYVQQLKFEKFGGLVRAFDAAFVRPLATLFPDEGGQRFVNRARNFIGRATLPLPDRTQSYNLFERLPLDSVFEPDFLVELDREGPLGILRDAFARPESGSKLQRMLHVDLQVTLADNDLRKVTKMCELAGLRVKFPLLDEDLIEFSARVPSKILVRNFRLRWFFRHAMRNFLCQDTLKKQKHGFGMPFADWIGEDPKLEQMVQDCAASFKSRKYIRPTFIDRVMKDYKASADSDFGGLIWDITMLEMWLRSH